MQLGRIEIFSQRSGAKRPPAHYIKVFIDRPSGSALQNPFPLRQESDRVEVLEAFESHIKLKLRSRDESVISALMRIVNLVISGQDVALMCWCAPKACHGNTVKRICEKKVKRLCDSGHVLNAKSASPKTLWR